MKTTIDLDDALLQAAELFAASEGTSLHAVLERALRACLERSSGRVFEGFKLRRHCVGGRGLRPELAGATEAGIIEMSYGRSPPSLPRD